MTSNGYTARVARVIAASTGADVFEVETAEPYPAGYRKTTDVVQDEFDRKIYRVLKKPLPDLSAYDMVFIGHPIWWGRIPPFLYKALSKADLSGKTVVHFVTHGGSGFGSSDRELREIAPKARFLKGLALYGEEVESSEAEIKTWLKELKFIK